jgi:hypothetical protein
MTSDWSEVKQRNDVLCAAALQGGEPTLEDEQRMMQQMRAEGLMAAPGGDGGAAGGGAAAGAAPLPEGAGGAAPKDGPGTKRIRREVFLKAANGSWQKSHEIVYLGRDRPGQLHSLYQVPAWALLPGLQTVVCGAWAG